MTTPAKIWWHGDPMTVGGLRWRITENDMRQEMKKALREYLSHWTTAGNQTETSRKRKQGHARK